MRFFAFAIRCAIRVASASPWPGENHGAHARLADADRIRLDEAALGDDARLPELLEVGGVALGDLC